MIARAVKWLLGRAISFGVRHMDCGAHVTRYTMYRRLRNVIGDSPEVEGKTILSISHSLALISSIGLQKATIVEANYPEHSAVDLSAFPSNAFDYVISDQVLEHVEGNPQAVFDETWRLLKPSGIAIHTTCLINPVHGAPSDYWRFTVDGLRCLARNFSEVIQAEGWGNRAVWLVDALGHRFTPVPHAAWHPLHKIATRNEPKWPITTWIAIRK